MLGAGGARVAAGGAADVAGVQGGLSRTAALKAEQKELQGAAGQTKSFSDRIREFQGSAFRAAATTYFMKGAIEGAWAHMAGRFTAGAGLIKSLAEPFANLTRLANPAVVKLFEMAWEDALAVVGRSAVPLIDSFRRSMEKMGDMYAAFEPVFTKFFERVGGALEMVFSTVAQVAMENAPALELMITAMGRAAQVAGYVATAFIRLTEVFRMPLNMLAKLLGFGDTLARGATSKGAAIRDVQITGSAEDFAREAQRKAFMQAIASGRGEAPAQDPLSFLPTISGTLAAIAGFVEGILGIARLWEAAKKGPANAGFEVGKDIGQNGVPGAGGGAGSAFDIGVAIADIAQSLRIFKLGG
jgi:hypothetical protein